MLEFKDIQNLPEFFTSKARRGYKFFSDKASYESGGGYKIRKLPDIDPTYFCVNLDFMEEHNLATVGDVLDLLNSWGFSDTLKSYIKYIGFTFDKTTWTWSSTCKKSTDLLLLAEQHTFDPEVSSSVFVKTKNKTVVFRDFDFSSSPDSCLYTVWCHTKQDLPSLGLPSFWTDQNGHKFTPEFITMRDNDMSEMTFGVEIEVNTELSKYDLQYLVTQVEPVQKPFFYFKHDGSIYQSPGFNQCYEIVTMPCTYGYLRKNFKILFDKLQANLPDWQSYFNVTDSCGVHVHINKDCFFSNLHLKKFVSIWNQFDPLNTKFIQKIGMRKFNKYCQIHQDQDGRTLARRLKVGAWGPGHDKKRYASCRETHHTAEVRVFKGGFTYDHIMYCLEAVHAMHQFSNKTPISLISTRRFVGEFTDWLNDEAKYNRLKEHLKCA